MSSSSIPVDLLNPGQVLACLGLMEIAQSLFGHAEGRFDDTESAETRFALHSEGSKQPIADALEWLVEARLAVLAPPGRSVELKWKELSVQEPKDAEAFPIQPPQSPAAFPAKLEAHGIALLVTSWGDETGRDKVKWWAGMAGYPGAALLHDALELACPRLESETPDPFAIREKRSSSFRFDVRGEYVPREAGFSPNLHSAVTSWGFPAVDVLASIGLGDARPLRPDPRDKLLYQYAVLPRHTVDVSLHRAALGCADLPYPMRWFEIRLDWPGQENQARSITSVREIDPS